MEYKWYNKSRVNFIKPLKDKISITTDSDLRQKLIELAEKEYRFLSQYINITKKTQVEKLENEKVIPEPSNIGGFFLLLT